MIVVTCPKFPGNHHSFQRIGAMVTGDEGYTVPWAMHRGLDDTCWLNTEYPVSMAPGGTVCMRITRLMNGFAVHIPNYDYEWKPEKVYDYGAPVVRFD